MGRKPKPRAPVDLEIDRIAAELFAHLATPEGEEEMRNVQAVLNYLKKQDELNEPEANPLSYVPEVPDIGPVDTIISVGDSVIDF